MYVKDVEDDVCTFYTTLYTKYCYSSHSCQRCRRCQILLYSVYRASHPSRGKHIYLSLPSSIGYRHSRLSSFGTSNFFKKMCVPTRDIFIHYLRSSGPHLRELLLYSCYVSFTLLSFCGKPMGELALDSFQFAGKFDCSNNFDDPQ